MCTLKAIILFQLVIGAVLITTKPSSAKRLGHKAHKKAASTYLSYVNGLFSDRGTTKRKTRRIGNSLKNNTPSGRIKVQLYCRTGFFLEVLNNGRIAGNGNVSSKYTILEFEIFNKNTRRVRGVASGRYLSLNNRGRLTTTRHYNTNTFFNENPEENSWFTYSSSIHKHNCAQSKKDPASGYIAIKRNGAIKGPCKTQPGMRATHFIMIPQKAIEKPKLKLQLELNID